jgi:hypothetical protein
VSAAARTSVRAARLRAAAAAIALAALAGAATGCGDESERPESPVTGENGRGGRTASEPRGGERPGRGRSAGGPRAAPSGDRQAEREAPPDTANGPGECIFEAPPGRLAEERIVVELEGIGCAEGRRLARAAALGQPAGANLEFDAAGFRCRPSTPRKGANVTYSCESDAGRATFDVVWSSG